MTFELRMIQSDEPPAHGLSFAAWLATEGGRRCPMCGRFAKPQELGSLGGSYRTHKGFYAHLSLYGHLPGFGCNRASAQSEEARR